MSHPASADQSSCVSRSVNQRHWMSHPASAVNQRQWISHPASADQSSSVSGSVTQRQWISDPPSADQSPSVSGSGSRRQWSARLAPKPPQQLRHAANRQTLDDDQPDHYLRKVQNHEQRCAAKWRVGRRRNRAAASVHPHQRTVVLLRHRASEDPEHNLFPGDDSANLETAARSLQRIKNATALSVGEIRIRQCQADVVGHDAGLITHADHVRGRILHDAQQDWSDSATRREKPMVENPAAKERYPADGRPQARGRTKEDHVGAPDEDGQDDYYAANGKEQRTVRESLQTRRHSVFLLAVRWMAAVPYCIRIPGIGSLDGGTKPLSRRYTTMLP